MAAARVTVTVEAKIHAAPDVVFRGFADPQLFAQWFISDWGEECTADVRAGGAWELKGSSPKGTPFRCSGTYEDVDAPNRIKLTFLWHADPGASSSSVPETWPQPIEVSLRAVDDDTTQVTFVHSEVGELGSSLHMHR